MKPEWRPMSRTSPTPFAVDFASTRAARIASLARLNAVWKPKPAEFAAFARAVAARYGAVADQFALLNEPNQGAWLQPQSDRSGSVSPHLYRALVRAAYPAVKAVAPKATVLIGELAPSGRSDRGTTRPIRPLKFLRETTVGGS